MIGGKVIEVIDLPERNKVWVNTRHNEEDQLAIYVKRDVDSQYIRVGDSLWWQGPNAYWTSAHFTPAWGVDIRIPRIGCCGAPRPKTFQELEDSIEELENRVSELEYENNRLKMNIADIENKRPNGLL